MELDFWKLVTVALAAFVAYVEYRQYRLGHEKLKLALFEKRFSVFAGARKLLSQILTGANVTLEQLFEYRASIAEASFLFGEELTDYLEKIYKKALDLRYLHEKMEPLPAGEERTKVAGEIRGTLEWLIEQLPRLKQEFSTYMKFKVPK
jgi:hypothetical protein